jgi:ubiquinone/menaquinone biosynthesis C-methylase UbiE
MSRMITSSTHRAGRPGAVSRMIAAVYDLATAGMEQQVFGAHRRRLLEAARGRILDVGAGTGANLPHYPWSHVSELVLLDPSPGMLARARRKATALGVAVQLRRGRAEQLPFEDESFDTIVFTLALCTIPDPGGALREARRVLRPNGRLLVLEHVRARDPGLASWQDRLTPLWKTIAGGCHPNRDTRATIEAAGFEFESVEEFLEKRLPVPNRAAGADRHGPPERARVLSGSASAASGAAATLGRPRRFPP